MIVVQFLRWIETAPAGMRADATAALARAYLHGDLDPVERKGAEAALMLALDDASPLVRRAIAEAVAGAEHAPEALIVALAHDQADVAEPVLARSPVLTEGELMALIAILPPRGLKAVATRSGLTPALVAAIIEVMDSETALILVENDGADITLSGFDRIVKRFGQEPCMRAALLNRRDLPVGARHGLMLAVSQALFSHAQSQNWFSAERSERLAKEMGERGTVTLATYGREQDMRPLVKYLREHGYLNAQLLLRALLSRHLRFVEEAFSELAGVPVSRVAWVFSDSQSSAFKALYTKAKLPVTAFGLFRSAFEAMEEVGFPHDSLADASLSRTMVERVLSSFDTQEASEELEPYFALLRRFYAEAARDQARHYLTRKAA